MKAQTMIVGHDGKKKINEGDLVICIQGNKDGNIINVNMDWSFAKDATAAEIKSFLGQFMGNIEDVFGEKMVTEMITHFASTYGHMKMTPLGPSWHFRSKGLEFKNWKGVKK